MFTDPKCTLLDDYLSGSLSSDSTADFENHLHTCDSCSEALSDWQHIETSLKQSFESVIMPNSDRIIEDSQTKHYQATALATNALSLAACLALAAAVAMTWYATDQTSDSDAKIAGQPTQNIANDDSVMYADAVFDEKTLAVRKCDDPDITVYQVFPKITLSSVE